LELNALREEFDEEWLRAIIEEPHALGEYAEKRRKRGAMR
jgi:hypothetical protein